MDDDIYRAIVLGFDGFIVCLGLGTLVPRRHLVPLSVAFGLCDAVASASGAFLGAAFPRVFALGHFKVLIALGLATYGVSIALLVARGRPFELRGRGWLLLPALLSLDNFVTGAYLPVSSMGHTVLVTAVTSGVMAYAGLEVMARMSERRWLPQSQVFHGGFLFVASLVLLVRSATS